jgi:hypothetical protein
MNPRTTGILVLVAAALGAFVYFYEIQGEAARTEAEEKAKRLFAEIEQNEIQWVEVTLPGSPPARIERREAKWHMTAPLDFPADAAVADAMTSTLASLTSESELENPPPPDEYGLGADARIVRFAAKDQEHTLRLGKDTPLGGGAYASAGGDAVYTVPKFKATSLAKRSDDLRDKRVLSFDPQTVTRIEASWPGGRVVLAREVKDETPGEWRLVEPIQGRADADTVADLLSDLELLRGDSFVDQPPADAEAGLAKPDFQVALTAPGEGEGAEPRVVSMAMSTPHENDFRWVRGASPSLYVIGAKQIEQMPRTLVAYRWKQVAKFDVAEARAMDFFFQPPSGDPVANHASRGDAGWTSTPEAFAEGRLDAAVAELSHLRADDIVADSLGESELRRLGLAPPNAIVTVLGAAPEEEGKPAPVLAEVQIGHVEGSEWIAARAAGDSTVYRLPYSLAEQLPVSLDAFRNRFEAPEGEEQKPAEAPPSVPGPDDIPQPSEESP